MKHRLWKLAVALCMSVLALAFAAVPAWADSLPANGTWGTCPWEITADGTLIVHPGKGAEQESDWGLYYSPWSNYVADITKIVFVEENGQKVIAPVNSSALFAFLYKAESIDLSGLDTSSVTSMDYMFYACASLTSLDFGNFTTTSVTSMYSMFSGCASLVSLDLRSFNTSNVTNMSYMFGTYTEHPMWGISGLPEQLNCDSLTYLDISSFDTTKVTDMSNMFMGANALQTFKVGAKFVAPAGTYGSAPVGVWIAASDGNSYYGETLVRRGVADTYARDNSVYTVGVWGTCPWVISNDGVLTVYPGTGAEKESDDFFGGSSNSYSLWSSYADHITAIVFVKENGQKAIAPTNCSSLFANLENVVSIDLTGLDTSRVTNMSYMFATGEWSTSSLVSINLSGFNTSNVTTMKGMFQGCTQLASLDLSGFNTSKVTDMSYMFGGSYRSGGEANPSTILKGCESLTSLNLSNFDTSRVTTMANMFYGCASLTSLDLSNFKTSRVTDMNAMFYGCKSLASLNISNFDTSNVTIMCSDYQNGMFQDCASLAALDVSGFNTSQVTNLNYMFKGCNALTMLDLSSWDTSKVTTMLAMFQGCTALKTIYASELWSLESIVEYFDFIGGTSSGTSDMFFNGWYWDETNNMLRPVYCALVGGNGTVFDGDHTDGEYARIDAAGQPGYFTYKAAPSAKTGWQNVNGGWYYYNADGTLLKDAFVPKDGKYYYVGKDGKLVTGGWIQYGGASYYIDSDWSLALNRWVENDGAYYYFDENAQLVANGWKQIGGKSYYFDENAQLAVNRFVQYGSAWYYFDENAQLVVNGWKQVGGKSYYFDESAQLAVNTLIRHDGKYYYFGADAQLVTDKWVGAGNDWYYFKPDGSLALNEWVTYQGYACHFNAKGICDNVRAA